MAEIEEEKEPKDSLKEEISDLKAEFPWIASEMEGILRALQWCAGRPTSNTDHKGNYRVLSFLIRNDDSLHDSCTTFFEVRLGEQVKKENIRQSDSLGGIEGGLCATGIANTFALAFDNAYSNWQDTIAKKRKEEQRKTLQAKVLKWMETHGIKMTSGYSGSEQLWEHMDFVIENFDVDEMHEAEVFAKMTERMSDLQKARNVLDA